MERRDFSRLSAGGLRMPRGRGGRRYWQATASCPSAPARRTCSTYASATSTDAAASRGEILLYLLDRARIAGMYEAFLEVRPSNIAAARLYHSLGFEQVGVRRGYYQATVGREDAAVLRRILQPDVK